MIDGEKNYASELAKDAETHKDLGELYKRIADAFDDKRNQSNQINDNWDCWNCKLNEKQSFFGDSQVYVPAIRDCVEARIKRVMSTIWPPSERHIRAVSQSGDQPRATVAMLEHHLRAAKFKELAPGILRNGDVEGQWSIYVDWMVSKRKVNRKKVTHPDLEEGIENPIEDQDDIEEEELVDERPDIYAIPTQDLAVLPATVDDIRDAEWTIVQLHLSKSEIKKKVKAGIFDEETAKPLLSGIEVSENQQQKDAEKERASDAGIKVKGKERYGLVWQAWGRLEIEGEVRPVVIHFGGQNMVLGVHKNPYWCQLPPVLSAPPIKVAGSFFGTAKATPVAPLQYQLNDIVNMGQDSCVFSVQQIVITDPNKNPRVESMQLARGAVWQADPNSTKFAQFPDVWRYAAGNAGTLINQIKESMDVNDAMLARPGTKKNVKQQAAESMEAMAAINDTAKSFEVNIMDPLLERLYEYDQQFREKDMDVVEMGEMGHEATIEVIPPSQAYKRYYFKWIGSETQPGIQRMQQKIAALNILRSVPPTAIPGKRIDVSPIIEELVDTTFSPSVGRRVLFDMTKNLQMDPEIEDEMMYNGLPVHVHPEDDDRMHVQHHTEHAKATGDPTGLIRVHISEHLKQMQAKMASANPPPQQGVPGVPGGAAPGVPGTPRPGAQPAPGRPAQQPPGAIPADSMQDPLANRV